MGRCESFLKFIDFFKKFFLKRKKINLKTIDLEYTQGFIILLCLDVCELRFKIRKEVSYE